MIKTCAAIPANGTTHIGTPANMAELQAQMRMLIASLRKA